MTTTPHYYTATITSSYGLTATTSSYGLTTALTTTSSITVSTICSYTITATVTPTITPKMFPAMVPNVTVDNNTISISGINVTLTLSWGEPFNNFDPIVNYTVSCSGDVTCPPIFNTTDNAVIITNLTPMTTYTFSVVATNSIGSGEAGVVNVTTPGEVIVILHILYSKFAVIPTYDGFDVMAIYVHTYIHTYE